MLLVKNTKPKLFSNDLFENFFGETLNKGIPTTDVYESDKLYNFLLELPGVNKEDIEVKYDKGYLTISGERKREETDRKAHLVESYSGKFKRTFKIPQEINEGKIDASFHDGILDIVIPKAKGKEVKRIEIKGA